MTVTKLQKSVKKTAKRLALEYGLVNLTRAKLCSACDLPFGSFQKATGWTFTELVDSLRKEGHTGDDSVVRRTRAAPKLRKLAILNAATILAREIGYLQLTRAKVAQSAGVASGSISRYYTMDALKADVLKNAVKQKDLVILAQGLALGEKLPGVGPKLRAQVSRQMAGLAS